MAKHIGAFVNLGIAREGTRGTCAASPTYWMPWTELNFDDKVEKVTSEEALGIIEDSHEVFNVGKSGEGDITGEIRDISFGLILYATFGDLATTALGGGDYSHEFSPEASNQHDSLTLFVSREDVSDLGDMAFCLSMINSLEVKVENGQYAKYTANFISRKSKDITELTQTITSEYKFVSTMVRVYFAASLTDLDSATATEVQNVSLMIEKNLLKKSVLGTIDPDDIINQIMSVTGSFTLPYSDNTFKTRWMDNTYRAMRIQLMNEDETLAGGNHPTLTFDMPRVSLMEWEVDRPKGELVEETINFKALHDVSEEEDMLKATLINEEDAY